MQVKQWRRKVLDRYIWNQLLQEAMVLREEEEEEEEEDLVKKNLQVCQELEQSELL